MGLISYYDLLDRPNQAPLVAVPRSVATRLCVQPRGFMGDRPQVDAAELKTAYDARSDKLSPEEKRACKEALEWVAHWKESNRKMQFAAGQGMGALYQKSLTAGQSPNWWEKAGKFVNYVVRTGLGIFSVNGSIGGPTMESPTGSGARPISSGCRGGGPTMESR